MKVCSEERDVGGRGSSRESGVVHDFVGADELISDLAALLDAGLVVVHEHVLGPARYGVARHPAMIGGAAVD